MSHEKSTAFMTEVRQEGEIARLKAKCKHGAEILIKIDSAIKDLEENISM